MNARNKLKTIDSMGIDIHIVYHFGIPSLASALVLCFGFSLV